MNRRLLVSLLLISLGACDGSEAKPDAKAEAKSDAKAEAKSEAPAKKETLPAVDEKAAESWAASLAETPADESSIVAMKALAKLEVDRLPTSMVDGIVAVTEGPPDARAVLLAKSMGENMELLDKACDTDGRKLMRSLATVAPEARDSKVWETCKFPRLGLVTEGDLANADALMGMMAHMIFVHLDAGSTVSKPERTLLQAMMKKTPGA
ncbi:MAG: hypothetical protein AAGA54_17210 [Myxococcota bacterium]